MTNEELNIIRVVFQGYIDDIQKYSTDTNPHNKTIKRLEDIRDKAINVLEQQPSKEWKEIYAESEGSNSWIEFKCPHCGHSFGMESGEYDWHYGDEIPWKYCPICGGSAEHNPYMAESEDYENGDEDNS